MATWMGSGLASGENSRDTAIAAATQALESMGHLDQTKLSVVFAAPSYALQEVVSAIRSATGGAPLIGCTSAGAFAAGSFESRGIAVSTIASDHCEINLGQATDYIGDIPAAVETATRNFQAANDDDSSPHYSGHSLLLLVDGLAGQAEMVIDELIAKTGIRYQLFGGAAADELQFQRTHVFINDEVLTNSFVCAEVLTEKPFSIVARHGWKPMDGPYRVTRSQGSILHELSGRPAWGAYQKFAQKHGIDVPQGEEASFLMRYILGIEAEGEYKLRVPLALNSDGSFACAAEVLEGDVVYIMTSDEEAIMSGE